MDGFQRQSNENYAKLVAGKRDMTTIAGRYARDAKLLPKVWKDIASKLQLKPNLRILDIGCGYGYITKRLISFSRTHHLNELTLVDIPEVVDAVREDLFKNGRNIQFVKGTFPGQVPDSFLSMCKFDRVLMYSVIHCSSNPVRLIDAAAALLKPGGLLLGGDIPNSNKKGRFLSSKDGRRFESIYTGVPISQVPCYCNQQDFLNRGSNAHARVINDGLLTTVLKRYRRAGYDSYLVPQPEGLPFCYTREDLIIRKYD